LTVLAWLTHRQRRVIVALLLWHSLAGFASGLQVTPIVLQLHADKAADALWLTNTGSEIIHAQVRVFRWTQEEGADRLELSTDLVASPPMLSIAPGARQIVRIIRRTAVPTGTEAAYRLIVDELPVGETAQPGLRFVLRYSIPVFIEPAAVHLAATLRTQWRDTAQGPSIQVSNAGTAHAQIADLVLLDAHGRRTSLRPGLVGYALPGSTMAWTVPATVHEAGSTLRARINGEATESTLVQDANAR
jgi:fimbrial chaperone protein